MGTQGGKMMKIFYEKTKKITADFPRGKWR